MHPRRVEAAPVLLCAAAVLFLLGANAASAEKIRLKSGDQLIGEVVERDDQQLILEHPVLGRLTIPVSELQVKKAADGLFGTSFLAGWKRMISAGLTGSEGESSNVNGDLQLNLSKEDESARQILHAGYFFARSDGEQTTNQFFAQYARDWLREDSAWFWFTQARYDYDEFRAWDHRISGSGGTGYDFYDTESFDLRGRLGLGFIRTFGGESDTRPEGLLGVEASWKLSDRHTIAFATSFHPNALDLSEYRAVSRLDWTIGLDIIEGLGLKIGLLHEYDSGTSENKNDLQYFGNLSYSF